MRPPHPAASIRGVGDILRGARVQAKLRVGAPDDPAEREADRVADQVMRMPDPATIGAAAPPVRPAGPGPLRRLCAECEEEDVRRRPVAEGHPGSVRREATAGPTPAVTPDVAAGLAALRGRGQPLHASERAFFEPRFGHDLGHVRIHTDARAARLARALNAHALSSAPDVIFAAAEYSPATNAGRRLLAHELTHVLQQPSFSDRVVQLQDVPEEEEFDDEFAEPSEPAGEEPEFDEEWDSEEEPELDEQGDVGTAVEEHDDDDRCNVKRDELLPLYQYEECVALVNLRYDYEPLNTRRIETENQMTVKRQRKIQLEQEKQRIEADLPQRQALHDARLAPLIDRRNDVMREADALFEVWDKADKQLQEAHDLYWSQFGLIATEQDKAVLIREAIGAQSTEVTNGFELVRVLVGKAVLSLAYFEQLSEVGAATRQFEEQRPPWPEKLQSLSDAEQSALADCEPVFRELETLSNEISALEADDPTRAHERVVAQIHATDQELQTLLQQYVEDEPKASEIVKKIEDRKKKCLEEYGTEPLRLYKIFEDYVESCQ